MVKEASKGELGVRVGKESSFFSLASSWEGEGEKSWKAVVGLGGNLQAADLW